MCHSNCPRQWYRSIEARLLALDTLLLRHEARIQWPGLEIKVEHQQLRCEQANKPYRTAGQI
jgi:hypothetical protein